MSLQNHLSELEKRHKALESEIQHETASPAGDALHLAELKRKKLQLKDEIARIRASLKSPTLH